MDKLARALRCRPIVLLPFLLDGQADLPEGGLILNDAETAIITAYREWSPRWQTALRDVILPAFAAASAQKRRTGRR